MDYHEKNRKSWNAATQQHHTHRPDLIERFKHGANTLYPEDFELLEDVAGQSLVHLQCNDGQDSLSIANHLGADVTGVDISDDAIDFARRMSDEANIPATFVRADLFDWFAETDARFDVAYTSYGALCWISDIGRWGRGVAQVLKPGGRVVIVEFHPAATMFEHDWSLRYNYMGGTPESFDGVGDYVGDDYDGEFKNPHRSFEFAWGVADVVTALLDAGLSIRHLREYPYMNGWKAFPDMQTELFEDQYRRHYPPADKPMLPMMYSVVAAKPTS